MMNKDNNLVPILLIGAAIWWLSRKPKTQVTLLPGSGTFPDGKIKDLPGYVAPLVPNPTSNTGSDYTGIDVKSIPPTYQTFYGDGFMGAVNRYKVPLTI